jgi:peptide/nickel transport system substrate-binding protein/oligopeptide transport system substrate-binding protein
MRHNARWSNGKPVTAQDFAYAWLRNAAPSNTIDDTWASVVSDVLNESEYHAGGVPASAVGVKVVNNYELKITLSTAVNIEGLLALAGSMPLYPPDVEAHSSNWYLPQYFVGDGPYVVHSFVTNGELEMTRNRDYVGAAGQENVGNVQQIDLIPEPTVPVEDFESHALDAAVITSPSDYQYAEEHLKSDVHKAPEANIMYLGWDHSVDASPLNNSWVRDAIAMAINRAPISDPVLNNMVGPTSIFGYPGFPTDADQGNPFRFNLGQARKLLTKAGYPDGKGIGTLYLYCQTTTNFRNQY